MKLPRRTLLHLAAGAAALPFAPHIARAQAYPSRPVTMVVPFAAGGAFDALARIIAPRMAELLGQQVVIENIVGAGGMTGAARVGRAAPDGYQMLLGDTGIAQTQALYKTPLYNPLTDLVPVALIAEQPNFLTVRRDLPVNDLREFVAYARANQTTMQFGSAGAGSPVHLACVLLNSAIGVKPAHIPYRGGAPAMQDLIAGRIDYLCTFGGTARAQTESKLVKTIAILSKNRSPILPTIPSAHEQGLTDLEAGTWNAIFLPKGVPAAVVQKLQDATVNAARTPAITGRLAEIGADVVSPERMGSEYLRQFVSSEVEKWGAIIKAAGINGE